jgi:hypothetical protein
MNCPHFRHWFPAIYNSIDDVMPSKHLYYQIPAVWLFEYVPTDWNNKQSTYTTSTENILR